MDNDDLSLKYVDHLNDRQATANRQRVRLTYLFLGISSVFYFFGTGEADEILLLGSSVKIAPELFKKLAPVVLAYIYYQIVALNQLETLLVREMRSLLRRLAENVGLKFETWQLRLLEVPDFYTWVNVYPETKPSSIIRWVVVGFGTIVELFHLLLFPMIFLFFFYQAFQWGASWFWILVHGLSGLLVLGAIAMNFSDITTGD